MKQRSAKGIRLRNNIIVHTILAILAAVWMFLVLWVVPHELPRGERQLCLKLLPENLHA